MLQQKGSNEEPYICMYMLSENNLVGMLWGKMMVIKVDAELKHMLTGLLWNKQKGLNKIKFEIIKMFWSK